MKKINLYIGSILFIISLVLAFYYHYNHFYELMLIGLFLIFGYLTRNVINKKIYYKTYIYFLLFAVIGDIIFGINVSRLWYYNYNNIMEYLLLIAIIYPFGGWVLIQTFFILESTFVKNIKLEKIDSYLIKKFVMFLLFLSVITFIFRKDVLYGDFIFYSIASIGLYLYLEYKIIKTNKKSFMNSFIKNPKSYLLILILGSFSQAIIQEFPNTFAKQWVYQNIPLINILILRVPILVFLGWVYLTLFSISVYYFVLSRTKSFKSS